MSDEHAPAIELLREIGRSPVVPAYLQAAAVQVLTEVYGIEDEDDLDAEPSVFDDLLAMAARWERGITQPAQTPTEITLEHCAMDLRTVLRRLEQ